MGGAALADGGVVGGGAEDGFGNVGHGGFSCLAGFLTAYFDCALEGFNYLQCVTNKSESF
jgi:hypothetical protein